MLTVLTTPRKLCDHASSHTDPHGAPPHRAPTTRAHRRMHRRAIARLVNAERDGSLYLACGAAAFVGAVVVALQPSSSSSSNHSSGMSKEEENRLVEMAVRKAFNAEMEQRRSSFREGVLMAQAPLQDNAAGVQSKSVASDPKPVMEALCDTGLCRVDACLSGGVVSSLLAHVNSSLADARSRVAVDDHQREREAIRHALRQQQQQQQQRQQQQAPVEHAAGCRLQAAGSVEVSISSSPASTPDRLATPEVEEPPAEPPARQAALSGLAELTASLSIDKGIDPPLSTDAPPPGGSC